jgi:Flp pilus assembly protein TadD
MNRTAFKIAASSVILAMTMVACTAQSGAMRRPAAAAQPGAGGDRQAHQHHERARQALQQGQLAQALDAIEQAVAASPRDVGYRLLLGDIYMKSGRFESARATFADVVELDPSNVRAGLSLALMHIAVGRPQAAVAQLDELHGRAPAADLGLAYALAGLPERAVEILEPAARDYGATPRLRQNLALSYALAGNWERARAVASQDVSPADLGARLQQWAAMARPDARSAQVASLLGVTPVNDPGQPVRLALNASQPLPAQPEPGEAFAAASAPAPAPEPIYASASAGSVPAPVYAEASTSPVVAPESAPVSDWGLPAEPEAAAPVQVAQAAPAPVPAPAPAYYLPAPPPAPAAVATTEEEVRFAAAARTLNRPEPAVIRTAAVSLPPQPVLRRAAAAPQVRRGNSQFVVQLGSFSIEGNAERAWIQAEQRFGLRAHQPLTTTFNQGGRTLHRVSVAGFASHSDAQRLCNSIKSRGGACFVRTQAGDAAVRWAARYGPSRNRNV